MAQCSMEEYLNRCVREGRFEADDSVRFPSVRLCPEKIRAVLINEVVARDPQDDFYCAPPGSGYLETALPLFREAGFVAESAGALLRRGVYLTNAVKTPKEKPAVETSRIKAHMPVLEAELSLFPRLKAILLMGDAAKKAFNGIARGKTGKAAVPAGSTYKIRSNEFFWEGIRIFPSYIITGKNILIEKSKWAMVVEDLTRLAELL